MHRLGFQPFGDVKKQGINTSPNTAVRALRTMYLDPSIWVLIGPRSARIRSLHTARFGLAYARPNHAYRGPLREIWPGHSE